MRKLGVYILVFVLLLLVASFILFSISKDGNESTSPSDDVRVDSLRLCEVYPSRKLQEVDICGSVVANKASIPLRMYLYKMPSEILVAENKVDDRFSNGEFILSFALADRDNTGSYMVAVYFYKEVVGELEFEINAP